MSSGALSLLNSSGTPFTKTSSERRALDTFSCLRLGRSQRHSHKVYRDQDLAFSVSMEVDTIFLSGQWELVCIRLGEFKAKPLQPHPADLAVVTRHDDPLDEVVHLVPIIALGERSSYPFWSDVKQGEMIPER